MSSQDINLLPENLREKEEKLKKEAREARSEIRMTAPPRQMARKKEAPKIGWQERLKKALKRSFGIKEETSIIRETAPVFQYEEKPKAAQPVKKEALKIRKEPEKILHKEAKKPEFFEKVFARPADSGKTSQPAKEKPEKLAVADIKINKLAVPLKREAPKKVTFWSKVFGGKKSVQKITPLTLPKKVSFFEKFFKSRQNQIEESRIPGAIPLAEKIKSAEKKKPKKLPEVKKRKSITISFISESEVILKLKLLRKTLMGLVTVLIFLIIIGFGYLFLALYQLSLSVEANKLDVEISNLAQQINRNKAKEQEMLVDQKRIKAANVLLAQHIYWTNLFNLLEKNTVDDVYYKNFSASGYETLTLQAVGRDYKSISRQLLAFGRAKELAREVKIVGGSFSDEGINFTVNLTLKKSLFIK